MKGLLIKDLMLIKKQRSFILCILAIVVIFLVFNTEDVMSGSNFVVGYLTSLVCLLAVSTISYDEADRGLPFLFTLPFSREIYVKEKYVLSMGLGAIAWFLTNTLLVVYASVSNDFQIVLSWVLGSLSILMIAFVVVALMIPINLRFGPEKGRVALMILAGGVISVSMFASTLLRPLQTALLGFLNSLSMGIVVAGFVAILIVSILVSYRISKKVMLNKEI